MSASSLAASAPFPRRTFLAASVAGIALAAAGCTSGDDAPAVTPRQVDALAGQVAVQERLVAAFAAAGTADAALAAEVVDLSAQVQQQLDRLRAAAPGTTASASAPAGPSDAPPAGSDARTWLRTRVADAAASHAAACLDQSGARAALLGSIAAGLRGQDRRLA
jgi:hypothetical protein